MSGIEMWNEYGMGFWSIIGALWWDVFCALLAVGWGLWIGAFWISSAIDELPSWIRWKDWKEILKWLGCGTFFIPLIHLIYLVAEIWFLK